MKRMDNELYNSFEMNLSGIVTIFLRLASFYEILNNHYLKIINIIIIMITVPVTVE